MQLSFFFDITLVLFLISTFFYLFYTISEKKFFLFLVARGSLVLGMLSAAAFMAARWVHGGQPPFTTPFEVMVFFSLCTALIYLIIELYYKIEFIGFPVMLLVLGLLAYSTLFESAIKPAMPALQNNFWLTIHVIFCFIGYAAFAVTYVLSLLYLLTQEGIQKKLAMFFCALTVGAGLCIPAFYLVSKYKILELQLTLMHSLFVVSAVVFVSVLLYYAFKFFDVRLKISEKLKGRKSLTRISYKGVLAGVPLLGIGIITGAVWADVAWGKYWSWDPKETWSLVTWFVYLLYLHLRFVKNWRSVRLAWISVGGFFGVMFTFFGVNYLLAGLHAYL